MLETHLPNAFEWSALVPKYWSKVWPPWLPAKFGVGLLRPAGGGGRELVTCLQTRSGRDALAGRVAVVLVLAVAHVEERHAELRADRTAGLRRIHPTLLFSLSVHLGDDRDAVVEGVPAFLPLP